MPHTLINVSTIAPKDWLHYPTAFGFGDGDWRTATTPTDKAELAAAIAHHRLAVEVRQLKRVHGLHDTDLADQLGVTSATISRYLRGATAIPLVNYYALAHAVGLNLNIELGR